MATGSFVMNYLDEIRVRCKAGRRILGMAVFVTAIFGMLAIGAPGLARADAAPLQQHMQYELYAAGLNAVTASMDVETGQGHYRVTLDAKTRGLLGRLVPYEGTFATTGWQDRTGFQPQQHRSISRMRDGLTVDRYDYGRKGAFLQYALARNGVDKTPQPLDRALADGTIDILTAALDVLAQVGRGGACDASSEIFDGERRYQLVFRDQGPERFAANNYNVFSGTAERCEAEVVPLAGKWHSKPRGWMTIQEQGRKAGSLPTVWLARMSKDGPAVPVRMRITTDYGTLYMHITNYTSGAPEQERTNDR
jgi:hypothetical protein